MNPRIVYAYDDQRFHCAVSDEVVGGLIYVPLLPPKSGRRVEKILTVL
jgi:hypothetical protein